jgi:hypothetical protein
MLRILLSGTAIMFLIVAQLAAAPVTYTIDPNQSSLLASGLLAGDVPFSQTFGSNRTTYNGTISADRTDTSIQFTFGSAIDADRQPSRQQPDIGGEDGSAVADYGWVASGMFTDVYAAFRDLVFDLSSDPLTVAGNGNFDSGFDIIYASGSVDVNWGFQWTSKDFTGRTIFNASSGTPSVVAANNVETLTLPVRFSTTFSTEQSNDSTFRLSGNIVATRMLDGPPPQWNKDGDGSWGDALNWDGGVPNTSAAFANFLGAITAPRTVTLDGDRTVGRINFDNANKYTLAPGSGGTLTIGSPTTAGQINLNAATHEISAKVIVAGDTDVTVPAGGRLILSGGLALQGTLLALAGGGALDLAGPQSHQDAALEVDDGTLTLNSDAGAPPTANPPPEIGLTLFVSSTAAGQNALVKLNASQHLQDLFVDYQEPGQQGLDLNSTANSYHTLHLYISGDGIPEYFADLINYGREHPGEGIFDSGLHANAAIGLNTFTDQFGNEGMLIRSTQIGDLNLDGTVTIADFIDLASNFGHSGPDVTWQQGDLNSDNAVTIADFIDLAANFGSSYAGDVISISASDFAMLNDFAAAHGITLVPEPAVLLLFSPMIFLMRRRRIHRPACTNPTFFPTARS